MTELHVGELPASKRGWVRWGQCDSEAMGSVDWVSERMFAHTVNTPAVVFGLHHVLPCLDEPVGLKWGW